MSWERLNLLADAHRKKSAAQRLRLAQLFNAMNGKASDWKTAQQELIEMIHG